VTRYPCSRCGKKDTAEHLVYSRFTGNRYCPDLDACDRRAKRRRKVQATAAAQVEAA
jgi:hypothetical protein